MGLAGFLVEVLEVLEVEDGVVGFDELADYDDGFFCSSTDIEPDGLMILLALTFSPAYIFCISPDV